MSALVVVAVVLLLVAFIGGIVFAAIRLQNPVRSAQAYVQSPPGPTYKHISNSVQYLESPLPTPPEPQKKEDVTKAQHDPRRRPLPRCSRCGTAIAYEEAKCHKCGLSMKTP